MYFSILISIHALVKRATLQAYRPLQPYRYFNPRPREEGDDSIELSQPQALHFNPRPREEGDSVLHNEFEQQRRFQSTPS